MSQQRAEFWQNSNGKDEEGIQEASKQFQPKKYKEATETRLNDAKQDQPFAYTPFKSATMNRVTTPQPAIKNSRNGTLRPPNQHKQNNPFQFNPQTAYNPNNNDEPPQSHSTPKAVHQMRPGSAQQMTKEQKLTWGRLPPQSYRSASVMGTQTMGRPTSRQSETIGPHVASRYPSYCTLPRPEEMDAESLHHLQSNLQSFYPPQQVPQGVISRPPSAVPYSIPPGMSSDYCHPPMIPRIVPQIVQPIQQSTQIKLKEFVNWNRLSLVASAQILCALFIFGIGIARMMYGSKWAMGVELLFSVSLFLAGLSGIYSVKRRCHAASSFSFILSTLNIIFAIPPFCLGLLPTIPWSFSDVNASWFVNPDEPLEIDLGLSLFIFLAIILCLIITISGCRSLGRLFSSVEDLRVQFEMRNIFTAEQIPHKQ